MQPQLLKKLRPEDCKFKAILGKNLKRRLGSKLMDSSRRRDLFLMLRLPYSDFFAREKFISRSGEAEMPWLLGLLT